VTAALAPARHRPALVTIAVVLIYVGGVSSTALGTLILLSRYQVESADVLPVSLLGAAVILFGLLTIAVASGVARGRRLARLLLTIYIAVQFALHIVTIVSTEAWDASAVAEMIADTFILIAVWAPPGSRYFRRIPADQDAGAATA
jgi:hypothetical protein